jgi:hypothetical protein
MPAGLTLDDTELLELTGYRRPSDQLRFLLERGFHRATIHRGRVLLERTHYDAVTRGQMGPAEQRRPVRRSERQKAAMA